MVLARIIIFQTWSNMVWEEIVLGPFQKKVNQGATPCLYFMISCSSGWAGLWAASGHEFEDMGGRINPKDKKIEIGFIIREVDVYRGKAILIGH